MQVPPNTATEYDVRQTFMGACRKLLHDDEAIQKKIKIVLNTPKGKIVQRKKNSSNQRRSQKDDSLQQISPDLQRK